MAGGQVSLVITDFGTKPTPVESHDSLGALAREERKRAGLGGCYSPTFLFHSPSPSWCLILCLILLQGPGGRATGEESSRTL